MAISLSEVLELDIFDNTELLTGQTGLNREVSRINFMDCPVIHDEIESSLTEAGDLYLLSYILLKMMMKH